MKIKAELEQGAGDSTYAPSPTIFAVVARAFTYHHFQASPEQDSLLKPDLVLAGAVFTGIWNTALQYKHQSGRESPPHHLSRGRMSTTRRAGDVTDGSNRKTSSQLPLVNKRQVLLK